MSSKLTSLIKNLRESEPFHIEVGLRMMKAAGGTMYLVDLLAFAAINRSANLVPAFISLIESKNLIAAAPLLRMQIDSCLRFSAVHLVQDPHEFAGRVLKGDRIDKIKDRSGTFLRDRYLVERLSHKFPWIPRVYESTSGYVHLSKTHIANVFCETPKEKLQRGIAEISIGPGDKFKDPALYEEAVEAFTEATRVLFHYLVGWVQTKDAVQPPPPPPSRSA